MVIVLSVIILVMFPLLIGTMLRLNRLQQHLELLDREQHTQNIDVIELMKYRGESSVVILQHLELLTYLCEQDPRLNKMKISYTGPMGEA
jgi:hypothetical protein